MSDSIRIANCSGFLGDRFSAAKEMVDGGPIDVLTGDYLAEVTMSSFYAAMKNNPDAGYADGFLWQARQVLADCLEKNIKIVVNAGGLNPKALVEALEAFVAEEGLSAKIAYIEGDNLTPWIGELTEAGETFVNMDTGEKLADCERPVQTANAYLGAWGIKEALDQGADVVIAPRVTDAALVIGPAAWKFGWARDDYDALAGALVAGHVIECGPQATGGNYCFFKEVPSFTNIGFPLAEVAADGSCVITKHPGTGGIVNTGTVTAQALYEINAPAYANPDVIAHFDTMKIEDLGEDRVRISGVRGSMPPKNHKVCINTFGGHKTTINLNLTGLDIDEKAKLYADELFKLAGSRDKFDEIVEEVIHNRTDDPQTNEEAFSILRITAKSMDENNVGFNLAMKDMELCLANVPGLLAIMVSGLSNVKTSPFVVHWPALVDSKHIVERVHMGGQVTEVLPTSQLPHEEKHYQKVPVDLPPVPTGEMVRVPLGRIFGTRSGDKGGHANVGVWGRTDEAYSYLQSYLTEERIKELMPDTAPFEIDRYEMPNIRSLNFLIKGYLGEGVAASARVDSMAKSMGEYLGCKYIEVPEQLTTGTVA